MKKKNRNLEIELLKSVTRVVELEDSLAGVKQQNVVFQKKIKQQRADIALLLGNQIRLLENLIKAEDSLKIYRTQCLKHSIDNLQKFSIDDEQTEYTLAK